MNQLAQTLERFNRKERNLLVRDALGHQETKLKLSAAFSERVASKLGIVPLLEDAWWATDYHINWLAGALATYFNDIAANTAGRANPSFGTETGRRLVEGNQEDIDLVIASGQDLIMVEAKAYGGWSNTQMASKLVRLNLLHAYYTEIAPPEAPAIRFHILLTSPTSPQRLTSVSPAWASKGPELPWIRLELDPVTSILGVTRCHAGGKSAADGDHWCVVEHKIAPAPFQEVDV